MYKTLKAFAEISKRGTGRTALNAAKTLGASKNKGRTLTGAKAGNGKRYGMSVSGKTMRAASRKQRNANRFAGRTK